MNQISDAEMRDHLAKHACNKDSGKGVGFDNVDGHDFMNYLAQEAGEKGYTVPEEIAQNSSALKDFGEGIKKAYKPDTPGKNDKVDKTGLTEAQLERVMNAQSLLNVVKSFDDNKLNMPDCALEKLLKKQGIETTPDQRQEISKLIQQANTPIEMDSYGAYDLLSNEDVIDGLLEDVYSNGNKPIDLATYGARRKFTDLAKKHGVLATNEPGLLTLKSMDIISEMAEQPATTDKKLSGREAALLFSGVKRPASELLSDDSKLDLGSPITANKADITKINSANVQHLANSRGFLYILNKNINNDIGARGSTSDTLKLLNWDNNTNTTSLRSDDVAVLEKSIKEYTGNSVEINNTDDAMLFNDAMGLARARKDGITIDNISGIHSNQIEETLESTENKEFSSYLNHDDFLSEVDKHFKNNNNNPLNLNDEQTKNAILSHADELGLNGINQNSYDDFVGEFKARTTSEDGLITKNEWDQYGRIYHLQRYQFDTSGSDSTIKADSQIKKKQNKGGLPNSTKVDTAVWEFSPFLNNDDGETFGDPPENGAVRNGRSITIPKNNTQTDKKKNINISPTATEKDTTSKSSFWTWPLSSWGN